MWPLCIASMCNVIHEQLRWLVGWLVVDTAAVAFAACEISLELNIIRNERPLNIFERISERCHFCVVINDELAVSDVPPVQLKCFNSKYRVIMYPFAFIRSLIHTSIGIFLQRNENYEINPILLIISAATCGRLSHRLKAELVTIDDSPARTNIRLKCRNISHFSSAEPSMWWITFDGTNRVSARFEFQCSMVLVRYRWVISTTEHYAYYCIHFTFLTHPSKNTMMNQQKRRLFYYFYYLLNGVFSLSLFGVSRQRFISVGFSPSSCTNTQI